MSAPEPYPLWTPRRPFPGRDEIRFLAGAVDTVVHRAGADRYSFLHDTAVVAHGGELIAAWYNCPDGEIVGESVIRGRRSADGGATWSDPEVIAADTRGRGIFYVPVVLQSHGGSLLAYVGNMVGHDLVTACEVMVDDGGGWTARGRIAGPFLPNATPLRLPDGCWAMGGRVAPEPGTLPLTPAVAISQGDRLTEPWAIVPIVPMDRGAAGPELAYPETTLIVADTEVLAVVRSDRGYGLLFRSTDAARTWTGPHPHTYPIGAAKPYAGTLSTGQRFLLSNTPTPGYRELLTIAVTAPGEREFVRVWKLRDGPSEALGVGPEWSYPVAIEHDGRLYVTYTSEKRHCVLTSAPVASLAVDAPG